MSEYEKMFGHYVKCILDEMTPEARKATVSLMEMNVETHEKFGLPIQSFDEIFQEVVMMFPDQCVFRLYDHLFMSVGDFKICMN